MGPDAVDEAVRRMASEGEGVGTVSATAVCALDALDAELSSLLVSPPAFRGGLSPATRRRSSAESADDGLLFVPTLANAHGGDFADFLTDLEPSAARRASPPAADAEGGTPPPQRGVDAGRLSLVDSGLDAVEPERTVTAPSPSGGLGRLVSDALAAADLARPPARGLARAPGADAEAFLRALGPPGHETGPREVAEGAPAGEAPPAQAHASSAPSGEAAADAAFERPRFPGGVDSSASSGLLDDVDAFGRESGESCSTEDREGGVQTPRALRHQHSGLQALRSARRRRIRAREEAMARDGTVEEEGEEEEEVEAEAGGELGEESSLGEEGGSHKGARASGADAPASAPLPSGQLCPSTSRRPTPLETVSGAPPPPSGPASLATYLAQALPPPQVSPAWPPRPDALPRIRAPRGAASTPPSATSSPKKRSNDARFDADDGAAAHATPKSRRTRSGSWAGSSRNGEDDAAGGWGEGEVDSGATKVESDAGDLGERLPAISARTASMESDGGAAGVDERPDAGSTQSLSGPTSVSVACSSAQHPLSSRLSGSSTGSPGRRSRLGRPVAAPGQTQACSGSGTAGSDDAEVLRRSAGDEAFARPLLGSAPPASPFAVAAGLPYGDAARHVSSPHSARPRQQQQQQQQQQRQQGAPAAARGHGDPTISHASSVLVSTLSSIPTHALAVPAPLPALRHASSAPPGLAAPGADVEGGETPTAAHRPPNAVSFFAQASGGSEEVATVGSSARLPGSALQHAPAAATLSQPSSAQTALPSQLPSLQRAPPSSQPVSSQHTPSSSQPPALQHAPSAPLPAGSPSRASQPPRPTSSGGTSVFRGVSRHRLTRRWEASLWLGGRQLYLGGFDSQEAAARAYDLAALTCKGPTAPVNFPAESYAAELAEVAGLGRDEIVAHVRRRSAAFSRGRSRYRGVSGHNGRWEARIGSFDGRKNVSFGVFETEEEAARQYDRALISEKGRAAKTNFPMSEYEREARAAVAAGGGGGGDGCGGALPRWVLALGIGGAGAGVAGAPGVGVSGIGPFVDPLVGALSNAAGGAFAMPGALGGVSGAPQPAPQLAFPPGLAPFPADYAAYAASAAFSASCAGARETGFAALDGPGAGAYGMRSLGSLPSSSQSEGDLGAPTPAAAQAGGSASAGGYVSAQTLRGAGPPQTAYGPAGVGPPQAQPAGAPPGGGDVPLGVALPPRHASIGHWPMHAVAWPGYAPTGDVAARASSPRRGAGPEGQSAKAGASYAALHAAGPGASAAPQWQVQADASRSAWAAAQAAGGGHPGLPWEALAAHGPALAGWQTAHVAAAAASGSAAAGAVKSEPSGPSRGFPASVHPEHAAWAAAGGISAAWGESEARAADRGSSTPRSSRGDEHPAAESGLPAWGPRHAVSMTSQVGGASAETSWSSLPTAEASWPPPAWPPVGHAGVGAGSWEPAPTHAGWSHADGRWTDGEGT